MEIYQLRSFMEIATVENLTKAANKLHISQSALSTQIKQLETDLNVILFKRSTRGMALTDQGRILLSYATNVINAANEMQEKATQLNGKIHRTLKIGLNTDGNFLKASKLNRLIKEEFPDIHVMLITSQTINTAEMLHQGLIDIGFFFGNNQDHEVISDIISTFNIRIAIPKSFLSDNTELTWQSLAKLPWILSACECPYYQIVLKEMKAQGLVPNHHAEATDESIVKDLLLDEQGIAVLREDDAVSVLASGKIVLWEDVRFEVPLRLGRLRKQNDNALLNSISTIIKKIWE